MDAGDSTLKPARPTPRRVAWGVLLSDAPWDGRPREVVPLAIPATAAGLTPLTQIHDAGPTTPRPRKRLPFGSLLASAPWAGRPALASVTPIALATTPEYSARP